MTIETILEHSEEYLESFRPEDYRTRNWDFVASGDWSDSPYHSGRCLYSITKNEKNGTWLIESTDLDDPDEDYESDSDEEKDSEDDTSLDSDDAPGEVPKWAGRIIAICRDAPEEATTKEMAEWMYDLLWDMGLGLDE